MAELDVRLRLTLEARGGGQPVRAALRVDALLSPPRGWPGCFSEPPLRAFLERELGGKRVRLCGRTPAGHAAHLELSASDSRTNAELVRRHMGWPVVSGYALYERADAPADAGAAERYIGVARYWNARGDDGVWIDATPRAHAQLVLVESPRARAPPAAQLSMGVLMHEGARYTWRLVEGGEVHVEGGAGGGPWTARLRPGEAPPSRARKELNRLASAAPAPKAPPAVPTRYRGVMRRGEVYEARWTGTYVDETARLGSYASASAAAAAWAAYDDHRDPARVDEAIAEGRRVEREQCRPRRPPPRAEPNAP